MSAMPPAERPHVALEPVVCPCCDSSESSVAAVGPDYDCHTCGDQTFTLVQCAKCQTYYLNPRPTTAMLPQIYSADDYYSYSFADEGNSIVLKARLARDRQKVTGILAALNRPASGVRAIDIGAGDGSLLEAFRSAGAAGENLFGAELAQHAVDRLNARGFRGLLTRAEEMDFPPDSFDVVTMIQVIEHVATPNKLVKHLGGMMSKGGILFFETPNMKSWDRLFFRKATWGGYHFPRHWTLWDPDTMTRMLNDSGFDVVSITTPPSAVVWVWSVNHVMQAWFGNGRIARFFSMNNPFALALFWLLELIPSKLGRSANMRIIARRR